MSYLDIEKRGAPSDGRCLGCGGREWITDPEVGEVFCGQCGLVLLDQIVSRKPEWRAFTPDERRVKGRVGPPMFYSHYDKGLSTTFRPNEYSGRSLSLRARVKMRRLKRWDTRARVYASVERNLLQAMVELNRLTDILHVPKGVKEEAALIYRKILNRGISRGRSIAALTAASLFAACRLTKTPRHLKDIVGASPRNRKDISRCYSLIQRELDLRMPIDDPINYIPKIASRFNINQRTQTIAVEIIRGAKRRKATAGKGPTGTAAAALYIASKQEDEKVTQREFAEAAGVTEVTVRNRCKDLEKHLENQDLKTNKAYF